MFIREWRKTNFPDQTLRLRAEMAYEIENRQVVESIKVKQVFRVHNGKTFVVDQAAGPKYVKPQMLVRVRPALAIPLLADDGRVAVGIKDEPIVRGGQHISQDLATDF